MTEFSDQPDVILDPALPGPGQSDREWRAVYHDPLTGQYEVTGTWELPDSPYLAAADEHTARVRDAGCPVPDGYVVELVQAEHTRTEDPAAWHRDAQGEDAVTRPVVRQKWRMRYRVIRDPRVAFERLAAEVDRQAAVAYEWPAGPTDGWHIGVSDAQTGEIDAGGSTALVSRWRAALERALWHFQKVGGGLPVTRWAGGDCITGTASQGGALVGRSDLTLDDQVVIAARMTVQEIRALLEVGAPSVTSLVVPSNHGQVSRAGKTVNTPFTASWDLAVAKVAALAFADDQRVRWILPDFDRQHVTVDLGDLVGGLVHGHQCRPDMTRWLDRQAGARTAIGAADLVVRGHDHTGRIYDHGPTTVIHLPPLAGSNSHFDAEGYGAARPRMLTFVLAGRRLLDVDGAN